MIKLEVQAVDLLQAIQSAGVVTPKSAGDAGAGYHIRISNTGEAFVYSRDDTRFSRASLPVGSTEGVGSFVLPVDLVKSLSYVDGILRFEASTEAPWSVALSSDGGATLSQNSLNPALISDCESELEDLSAETVTYPAAVLKAALQGAQAYTADSGSASSEVFKTYRLWDGSDPDPKNHRGNGVLYCSDERRAYYFQTKTFQNKGLVLHQRNYPAVAAFLGSCGQDVTLSHSDTHYVLSEGGRTLGWLRDTVSHTTFSYYGMDKDMWVFRIPKEALIKAIKYVQAAKPAKFRWLYEGATKTLRFSGSQDKREILSNPVTVTSEGDSQESFEFNADVDHTLELFDSFRGNEVSLRLRTIKDKGMFAARSVEEFYLDPASGKVLIGPEKEDAVQCRVTRLMPSKS